MKDELSELLEQLQRFLDAGDESRYYQLNRDEVRLVLHEIDRLRGREIKILSFADIRDEVRKKDREKQERQERADRIVRGSDG